MILGAETQVADSFFCRYFGRFSKYSDKKNYNEIENIVGQPPI
jgi:hypothetical protein